MMDAGLGQKTRQPQGLGRTRAQAAQGQQHLAQGVAGEVFLGRELGGGAAVVAGAQLTLSVDGQGPVVAEGPQGRPALLPAQHFAGWCRSRQPRRCRCHALAAVGPLQFASHPRQAVGEVLDIPSQHLALVAIEGRTLAAAGGQRQQRHCQDGAAFHAGISRSNSSRTPQAMPGHLPVLELKRSSLPSGPRARPPAALMTAAGAATSHSSRGRRWT